MHWTTIVLGSSTILIGILTIIAILVAPRAAVRIQRDLDAEREQEREKRMRKLWVFYTLMETRGTRLDPSHVRALNRIDLDFQEHPTVRDAWHIYHNHLNIHTESEEENKRWGEKANELLSELLYKMSQELGYDLTRDHLQRVVYVPTAFGSDYAWQQMVRHHLWEVLEGKRPIPITQFQADH